MKEALKLALEALESKYIMGCGAWREQQIKAIAAIKEALAQDEQDCKDGSCDCCWTEQEPVAFYNPQHGGFYWAKPTTIHAPQAVDIVPLALYITPPKAQPEQARNFCPRCGKRTPDPTTIHTCTPPRGLEMT